MTNVILNETSPKSSFLDYFEKHKLKLGVLPPGCKSPFSDPQEHPSRYHTADRAAWVSAKACSVNFAIPGEPNNLFLIDIDIERVGIALAWQAYVKLLTQIGIAEPQNATDPFAPQGRSRSGGFHVYVRLPAELPFPVAGGRVLVKTSDCRPLTEEEKAVPSGRGNKEVIAIRYRGEYLVAPGSHYDGTADGKESGDYALIGEAAPYECPAALLELMREKIATIVTAASPKTKREVEELLQDLPDFVRDTLNEEPPEGERSERIAAAVGALIRCGCSDDEIAKLLIAHPVGAKFDGKLQRAHKEAVRLRGKGFGAGRTFKDLRNTRNLPALAPQLKDFVGYSPKNLFYYTPTGQVWTADGINARFGEVEYDPFDPKKKIRASNYISRGAGVDALTWFPGMPMIVEGKHYVAGGWMDAAGRTYNTFRPGPMLPPPPWADPSPWIWHINFLYPQDAGYIIKWLAFAVRNPGVKINHALCLFGPPRIGKDTLLVPARHAAGAWNFSETNVTNIYSGWTTHLAAVITRVNEIHDLGDGNKINRYQLYEKMKTMLAAPPESNEINGKYAVQYMAPNVANFVIGSNHKVGGLYLPADDERHYVAWSSRTREKLADDYFADTKERLEGGANEYFNRLHTWLSNGGTDAVAAYLRFVADLSTFDPKANPPKTDAWREIVAANMAPEDAEWFDVLEALGKPSVVTVGQIKARASHLSMVSLMDWMNKNRRGGIDHRFENNGYVRVANTGTTDGRWKIGRKNEVVYGRKDLSPRDHFAAIATLNV